MKKIVLISLAAGVVLTGCAPKSTEVKEPVVHHPVQRVVLTQQEVKQQPMQQSLDTNLYPPNAKPGECYARVLTPAKYAITKEKVLAKAASEKIEIIPATYKTVTEKVLVREESVKLQVIPATYKTVTEKVLTSPDKEILVKVPAKYKTVTEKILVKPAYTTWKRGVNPVTGFGTPYAKVTKDGRVVSKHDQTTGEIMCLVNVPAEYKTVTRKVVATPERVEKKIIAGKYSTITKRVIATPATTKQITIPAQYKTVNVKKMVTPARTVRTEIPAVYKTIEKRVISTKPTLEWREILCETNTNPNLIRRLQAKLNREGYSAGAVDGVLGRDTLNAIVKYQKDHNLATGQLTLATLKSLGL